MELGELIRRFRTQANDKVEPYFNEDEDVKDWLNDAVNEACIRGRLVHESHNADVCAIQVAIDQSQYPLHESIYEITRLTYVPGNGETQVDLRLVSEEWLNLYFYENWPDMKGKPQFAIQSDTALRLVPKPDNDGELFVEGYRTAIVNMALDSDKPSDLHKQHHVQLVEWALYKAFSIPDTEFFDPNRSAIAYQNFENYFGVRPDSDLRRQTREDYEHRVKPDFI